MMVGTVTVSNFLARKSTLRVYYLACARNLKDSPSLISFTGLNTITKFDGDLGSGISVWK
jgi:hypothetical protein